MINVVLKKFTQAVFPFVCVCTCLYVVYLCVCMHVYVCVYACVYQSVYLIVTDSKVLASCLMLEAENVRLN